jgi:glycosyltransferase involved in cell wall biosynthesis
MIKILMCGPIEDSGGVSIHTKNISKYLSDLGDLVFLYNTSSNTTSFKALKYILNTLKRSFGVIFKSIQLRDKYDIIHIQSSGGFFSFITVVSGLLSSKLLHKNLVITFHYRPSEKFVSRYKPFLNLTLKNCDTFFVVSEKQKKLLSSAFFEYSSKIYVIPNGFNDNEFKIISQDICRNKLSLPVDKKILLNIGNLVPEKGQKYLIEAMNEIVKYRTDILCIIVGSGKLRDSLEKQVNKLQLTKYVSFAGMRPHDEIPFWINACDIFVLPSVIEGNPTVMFECLGCGKPFLGTNVGGIPEIIISDEYGLLTKPNDVKSLAYNICISLDKKWNYKEIKKYSDNYSWISISNKVQNIYESIYNT